jgi:hypothetical protein
MKSLRRINKIIAVAIYLFFSLAFKTEGQIEKGYVLKGLTSVNVGLYYLDNGEEGKTIPKLGYSMGLQVLKVITPKLQIGIEIQLLKIQSQISDFRTTYGYYSAPVSYLIEETKGNLYMDELNVLIPLFIRHNLGKKRNIYLEYGVDYKRLIDNSSTSNLKNIKYYPIVDWTLMTRPYANPIVNDEAYYGFTKNRHRFGVNIGMGGTIKINDQMYINVGMRASNYTVLFFPNSQNPKFRSLELRCEIPIVSKQIQPNKPSIKRYR